MSYRQSLNDFEEECIRLLGSNLTSIVLFGSFAKGKGRVDSDADLLVITKKRISKEKETKLLEVEYEISIKYGITISSLLFSEQDVIEGVEVKDRLLLGILLGYQVIYDGGDFFSLQIKKLEKTLNEENAVYVEKEKAWHIPSIKIKK